MGASKAYDRTLAAWAKTWKEESLTDTHVMLIHSANADLYGAGDVSEDYPGFTSACALLGTALRDLPRDVWLDVESETWTEMEPEETEDCDACDGKGVADVHCLDANGFGVECEPCGGSGRVFTHLEGWYHVESAALRVAILGRELAAYVR